MRSINLSTRPFYNERAVHAALALLAVVVVGVTAFNLWQVFGLSRRQADLQARIDEAGAKARSLRTQASRIRASINPSELDATLAAAREANELIDRRVFSWTELLNQFEATLPPTVRISAVKPRVGQDRVMIVEMVVVARSVEGVDLFIENLEKAGTFSGLLSREEFVNEGGLIQASLEGRYTPRSSRIAAAAPGASR